MRLSNIQIDDRTYCSVNGLAADRGTTLNAQFQTLLDAAIAAQTDLDDNDAFPTPCKCDVKGTHTDKLPTGT
jgi:20S proteasome alpha/beta subunit